MGVGGGETCVWGLSDRLGWVSRPLTPLSLTPWFFRSYRHHRFPRLIEIPPRGAEKPLSADSFLLSLHCEDSGLYTRPVQRNFLGPVNINLETQNNSCLGQSAGAGQRPCPLTLFRESELPSRQIHAHSACHRILGSYLEGVRVLSVKPL